MLDTFDTAFLIGLGIAALYYFRGEIFGTKWFSSSSNKKKNGSSKEGEGFGKKEAIVMESEAKTRDFVLKMNRLGKKMVIFFGSQTGTAEDYSIRLVKEANQMGIPTMLADLDDYDMEALAKVPSDHLVVFLVATYGEGEPTDNAQTFFQWLRQDDLAVELSTLNYVVFGLGNKTYEHYNLAAKILDERLKELGGKAVIPLGLGDDDGSLEEDFMAWTEGLWLEIGRFFGKEVTGFRKSVKSYFLDELPADIADTNGNGQKKVGLRKLVDARNPYHAQISNFRNLTPKASRECMHIEFDVKNSGISYVSGDHLAIVPENDPGEVVALAERLGLGLKLDVYFKMTALDSSSSKKHPFPCPTTYRIALSQYLDIMSPPKGHILSAFAEYAESEDDRAKILEFLGTENKKNYVQVIENGRKSIREILEDYPSVKIPVDLLFELLPRLQVRYYSISSSSRIFQDSIHITAMRLEYSNASGRLVKGVATNWLHHCSMNKLPVQIYVRRSKFKLPKKPNVPVVMVGPGTGFAPFRGFLQDRSWRKEQGQPLEDTVLFYGCRNEALDFLYKDEIQGYVESGLLKLYTAFSRDTDSKVYVQDRILEQADLVYKLVIEQGGSFYVCGDAKNMARDVSKVLTQIVSNRKGLNIEQAGLLVKSLRSNGRYQEDVWS